MRSGGGFNQYGNQQIDDHANESEKRSFSKWK